METQYEAGMINTTWDLGLNFLGICETQAHEQIQWKEKAETNKTQQFTTVELKWII